MASNFYKLYPQYQITADRRCQSVPVAIERRSGNDRRAEERITLPTNIKRDLYSVKESCEHTFAAFKSKENSNKDEMLPYLKNAVEHKQKEARKKEFLSAITSPVPMMRRLVGIKNNQDDKNPVKAIGLTTIAAINAKEDVRDILSIFGKVKSEAPKGYCVKYGFFVGTTVEERLNKSDWGKDLLRKFDITIGETKFGSRFLEKINTEPNVLPFNKTVKHIIGGNETLLRKYVCSKKGSSISKLAMLTLYRMPQLSLLMAGLLELPSIFKAKKKNKLKQIANSTLNVVCGVTCGALLSASAALLVPSYIGLPVMALGIGYYIGSKIAKNIGFKSINNDV